MATIKQLKKLTNPDAIPSERVYEDIYPVTHERGVMDDNGNSLEQKLQNIESDVQQVIDDAESAMQDMLEQSAVRTDTTQDLTDAQKATALGNLGISGIDDEPIAGSENLVKSDGIVSKYGNYQESEANGHLYVLTDANDRIILLVKKDGDIVFGAGVPQQFIEYVQNQIDGLNLTEIVNFLDGLQSGDKTLTELLYNKADKAEVARKLYTDNAEELYGEYGISNEYLYVLLDNNNKLVAAFKQDADLILGFGVPTQVKTYLQNVLDTDYGYYEEGQDYLYVLLDNNNKVIAYFGTDSNLHVNGEIYSPTIDYLHNMALNQTHILNIANSDEIAIIGDSYTQSGYCVKGKSYIAKLSLFSDYIFSNFGVSGDIYVGRMNAIREKTPANGSIPIDEQGIKYAMMCCYTNDIKYMSDNDYILCARQMALFLIGVGINPILCTEYHTKSRKIQIRNSLNCLAKELNIPFYDIASITDLIYNNRSYSPFWGGTHPGTRSNAIESDNYEKYLFALERPMRSLKIFRARTNTYESLDEYMFHSTEDRAKLFNEILVGAIDLVDASNVDNCTTAAQQKNPSEYQKLAENTAVNFGNVSLLSAILSTEKKDLKSLKLNISHDSPSLQVMVKNAIAEPYTHYVKLSSFYITFTNEPSVGDVYRCEEDGRNYTVQGHIIEDNNQYHLLCSPFVSSWDANTGTLTKVSGDGDDSIAYTYRERGMQVDVIDNDTLGHWVEVLPNEDGSYDLLGSNVPSNIIDIDRIDILLISSSSYNITDVSFEYLGEEKCVHKGEDFVFKSNYYNQSQELLPSSTFGAVGVLDTNWNVTPTNTYESLNGGNVYPVGCSSKVDISKNQKLSCVVTTPYTDTAVLELWCRYFPDIYTDGSGNQITETSYDYSDVIVKINGVDVRERVNTHWKIVRFPINTFENTALSLEVSSDKGIEVCYISLKY